MNQLKIKPGSVFICGPINGDLLAADRKFAESEEVLNSFGLSTINQFMLFNSKGFKVENVKHTIMHLVGCNTLVTHQGWAGCEFAKKQVEIARILEIDVIDYSKLVLHLTEKPSKCK